MSAITRFKFNPSVDPDEKRRVITRIAREGSIELDEREVQKCFDVEHVSMLKPEQAVFVKPGTYLVTGATGIPRAL